MSKTTDPVYTCDTPGCRSRCQITAEEDKNAEYELNRRGWLVVEQDDSTEFKTYCPACKSFGRAPKPEPAN